MGQLVLEYASFAKSNYNGRRVQLEVVLDLAKGTENEILSAHTQSFQPYRFFQTQPSNMDYGNGADSYREQFYIIASYLPAIIFIDLQWHNSSCFAPNSPPAAIFACTKSIICMEVGLHLYRGGLQMCNNYGLAERLLKIWMILTESTVDELEALHTVNLHKDVVAELLQAKAVASGQASQALA